MARGFAAGDARRPAAGHARRRWWWARLTTTRDKLSAEELAIVLSHYDLGLVQEVREFARGSHRAAKLVLRTDRGRYLLKRRPQGRTDPHRVAFAHELQTYLIQKQFPLPHLIGTREGNHSMVQLGDSVCEVFEFIDGQPYDGGLLPTYQAGKMLGLYHRLVYEYEPKYRPPEGHYHNAAIIRQYLANLPARMANVHRTPHPASEIERVSAALKEAYEAAAAAADALDLPEWEPQIVHSDWHPGNMLFREGHVVAVIDYDAARVQPRVMDVANGVLQFSMVTGTRNPDNWPDYTDESRVKRFLRGYDEINILSVAELKCVPHLMQEALIAEAVIPVWNTGRFASLDGVSFLRMVRRKVAWIAANAARLAANVDQ